MKQLKISNLFYNCSGQVRVISLILIMYLLSYGSTFSQDWPDTCATEDIDYSQAAGASIPCFDIQSINDNCIPVFLKVIIHFFDDDNCGGNLHPFQSQGPISDVDAYQVAEDLVNSVNNMFSGYHTNLESQWYHYDPPGTNNQRWGPYTISGDNCIPIRVTLEDVLIHKSSADRNKGRQINVLRDEYGVDINNIINIFIAECSGCTGAADEIGGTSFSVETPIVGKGTFIHELGHTLKLEHTHQSTNSADGCSDTWTHGPFTYDVDLDGDDEVVVACWNNRPKGPSPEYLDLCDSDNVEPDPIHPCCDWGYQNNNVMTYSEYANNADLSAITDCQLDIMMNYIAQDTDCRYIEHIGGECPPPQSVIGLPCSELMDEEDCNICFHLEASSNDEYYKLEFFEKIDQNNLISIRNTGYLVGPASWYCISGNWPTTSPEFKANTDYVLVMTTENICGDEDVKTLEFTTPNFVDCGVPESDPEDYFQLSPNPVGGGIDNLNITFEVPSDGAVLIYKSEFNNPSQTVILVNGTYPVNTTQVETYNTSTWNTGYHTIVMETINGIFSQQLLRI